MNLIIKSAKYIKEYEEKPRKYGTEDILYQVECHTIDLIGNNRDISITSIAQKTKKSKSAVSQIIDKLVKKNLVLKLHNPKNDNSLILELTEKGETVFVFHKNFDQQSYKNIFNDLNNFSQYDLEIYINIQKQINKHLKINSLKK